MPIANCAAGHSLLRCAWSVDPLPMMILLQSMRKMMVHWSRALVVVVVDAFAFYYCSTTTTMMMVIRCLLLLLQLKTMCSEPLSTEYYHHQHYYLHCLCYRFDGCDLCFAILQLLHLWLLLLLLSIADYHVLFRSPSGLTLFPQLSLSLSSPSFSVYLSWPQLLSYLVAVSSSTCYHCCSFRLLLLCWILACVWQ